MRKLKLNVDAIAVASFHPAAPSLDNELFGTRDCTEESDCAVTAAINSCWCSEYNSCDCT